MSSPKPGEVYWANVPGGRRRCIVVSNEAFNGGDYVTVVPTTATNFAERAGLKNCVPISKGAFNQCFTKNCVAQAEHVATLPKARFDLSSPICTISPAMMAQVIAAIGYVISARCVPQS